MQTSQAGLDFIAKNEGFAETVSPDNGGKRVVGYGHDLLPGERFPNGVTKLQAWILLEDDVAKWDKAIASHNLKLTQTQWDCLSDFTHECGVGGLGQLLAHGVDQVPYQLYRVDSEGMQHGWIYAKDAHGVEQVQSGMVARRQSEIDLWNRV